MSENVTDLPAESSLYSVLTAQSLLQAIQDLYRLGSPVCGRLLRAWANDVYDIRHAEGHAILKVYRSAWRSAEEVAWEADLQAYLAANGIGVVPIIPLADGSLTGALETHEGPRPMTLSSFIEGIKPDHPLTPEFYSQFGRLAAEIHQASDRFSSLYRAPMLDLAALVDTPLATVQLWFESRPDDWAFLSWLGNVVHDRLDGLIQQGMDWGICQGDYSLDNVYVVEDDRLILHDFDHAAYSWRALDLNGVQVSPRADWEAFLAGYTSIRPLSEADVSAGPYIQATNYFRMMAREVTFWAERAGTLRVEGWIDTEIQALRAWSRTYL